MRFQALFVVAAVLSLDVQSLAQNASTEYPSSFKVKTDAHQRPPSPQMMPMPIVAPLFIEGENTESTITMVNNSSRPLNAHISLTSLSGVGVSSTAVVMPAYSHKSIKIADLLNDTGVNTDAQYGSVEIVGDRVSSLAAQLSIITRGRELSDIEEEFAMMMNPQPAEYRAVVGQLSAQPILAIRSLSSTPQTVSVSCSTSSGVLFNRSSRQILPNHTILVEACHSAEARELKSLSEALHEYNDSHGAFAVSVSSSAPSSELAVFGVGQRGDRPDGQWIGFPFWDVTSLHSASAIYPGVDQQPTTTIERALELHAVVGNFALKSRNVTVLLSGPSEDTQKVIAQLSVAPRAVSVVNLPEVPRDPFGGQSLIIQSDGAPGDVLSGVLSTSKSEERRASLWLPWKDSAQVENGGEHPWIVSPEISSTLVLFNPDLSLKNKSVQVTIHAGEMRWSKSVSVPPSTTLQLSLRDIIAQQQKDDHGRVLPKEPSQGIVTWSTGLSPRVFGKLVQTDDVLNVSRAFACGSITSNCSLSFDGPNPSTVNVGQQGSIAIFAVQACTGDSPCSCNDSCGSATGNGIGQWDVQNSSIVSLNGGGLSAAYTGRSVGQTYVNATVTPDLCTAAEPIFGL